MKTLKQFNQIYRQVFITIDLYNHLYPSIKSMEGNQIRIRNQPSHQQTDSKVYSVTMIHTICTRIQVHQQMYQSNHAIE